MPLPRALLFVVFLSFFVSFSAVVLVVDAQDYDDGGDEAPQVPHPKAEDSCNGVFLTYTFISREKEFPHVKNASAQAYAFRSQATILNTMDEDLKAWNLFVGFQHKEIIVSTSGAVIIDGTDYPASVGNGTTLAGYPMADLANSIDTAGDANQIQLLIQFLGTQFGVKPPGVPMPSNIKLVNDGFRCPMATHKGSLMFTCCVKDKKFKPKKKNDDKFLPRQAGDLLIAYDVLQSFGNNYLAQVTIDNNHPLGRLDNWNLTWEWKRGEFINTMRGAYITRKDPSECLYGEASSYYQNFDFSNTVSCATRPVIIDLPPERANDSEVGKLPFCCKNGTLLPQSMDSSMSRAIFQLQVFKTPPDLNRTVLYPPANFKINGYLNPHYQCGPAVRVSPQEFPDPSGLMTKSYAIASWQVACNITKPEKRMARCCVSFSAYYNDSVVPCNTCACGCSDDVTGNCDPKARALLLPPEALLIPADNRTAKANAWAKIKHMEVPARLPCPDQCGMSINWHVQSNYRSGWSARVTLFNWGDYTFKNWFAAVEIPQAMAGYENVYSFNGTRLAGLNDTIFMQGLPDMNYLMPEVDGLSMKSVYDVPGKQQSVISFKKKDTPGISIPHGDGFPTRIIFNGEECALPDQIPNGTGRGRHSQVGIVYAVLAALLVFVF